MGDLWAGICILCILVGCFVCFKLPNLLTERSKNALEAEKERTKQKEFDFKTAQLKAGERTVPIGDNKQDV